MAHKKAQWSTNNGRDSNSKRLGVKVFGGESLIAGAIIVRQKGNKFYPGEGVGQGKDGTLYALKGGIVKFFEKVKVRFDGRKYKRIFVTVV